MEDINLVWASVQEQEEPRLIQQRWTYEQWEAWLQLLTPRLIVQHVRRWSLLAEERVELREHLGDMIAEALATLRQRECHL